MAESQGAAEVVWSEEEAGPLPLRLLGALAAEVFLLELLEVFLGEHGALGCLLLLLDHGPVTGLAAPVLMHNLGVGGSQDPWSHNAWHSWPSAGPSPDPHTRLR